MASKTTRRPQTPKAKTDKYRRTNMGAMQRGERYNRAVKYPHNMFSEV